MKYSYELSYEVFNFVTKPFVTWLRHRMMLNGQRQRRTPSLWWIPFCWCACTCTSAKHIDPHAIYVASSGSDSKANAGTTPTNPLATCAAAVEKLTALLSPTGVPPPGGVEVVFASGSYPLTAATACGVVTARGTAASPVVFRVAPDDHGDLVFDATKTLTIDSLSPVTNATVRALLNPNAATAVRALPVSQASGWTGDGQQLQWGAYPLTPSVW
jgi:hypothetical protein